MKPLPPGPNPPEYPQNAPEPAFPQCDFGHIAPTVTRERHHPVVDGSTQWALHSETRQSVVYLSAARAHFLRRAYFSGRAPILVSDGLSALTEPMRQALITAGGGWAVRGGDGVLRNGLTGRRLMRVGCAANLREVTDLDELAIGHLRPMRATSLLLEVLWCARHPRQATRLGATVETLTQELGGTPAGYGPFEPTIRAWNAREMARTASAHHRRAKGSRAGGRTNGSSTNTSHTNDAYTDQPDYATPFRAVVTGSRHLPLSLVLESHADAATVTERVRGVIRLGLMGSAELPDRLATLPQAVARLVEEHNIAFALIMLRPGNEWLTRPPVLAHAPTPVALVLGAQAARFLGIDPPAFHAARPHVPLLEGQDGTVLFPLARPEGLAVPPLAALLQEIGWHRACAAMGLPPDHIQAVWEAARF